MNLASEKQPLASEIIADQAAEVKKLKAELQEAEELRDIYYTQKSVCQMQLDIVNLLHIYIPRKRYRLYMELRKVLIRTSSKKNRRKELMERCDLTQVPCRKAIMEVVQNNKNRRSLQHTYELAELFQTACSCNKAFMELSEEDQERFWLITDALMMNDLEDLKRVHNLANYLMVKRIKDNVKVAEA